MPALRIVEGDLDDDKFIECAVAMQAGYVVSGEKKLLVVGDYMGIRTLPPLKFSEEIFQS